MCIIKLLKPLQISTPCIWLSLNAANSLYSKISPKFFLISYYFLGCWCILFFSLRKFVLCRLMERTTGLSLGLGLMFPYSVLLSFRVWQCRFKISKATTIALIFLNTDLDFLFHIFRGNLICHTINSTNMVPCVSVRKIHHQEIKKNFLCTLLSFWHTFHK